MSRTSRNSQRKNTRQTRRRLPNSRSSSLGVFQQKIIVSFMEMLITLKLFHWKTYSYPAHKATDELYGQLSEHMDKFMEVLMGKSGVRTDFTHRQKHVRLIDLNTADQLRTRIQKYKNELISMDNEPSLKGMMNGDLFTVRDEILADCNQFLYLLSLNQK